MIPHLPTLAAAHAWRATQGELDTATTAAFLARLAELREQEAGK